MVRGIRTDVDRAVKEIKKIVEDAQNDEIISSYVSIYFSCLDELSNISLQSQSVEFEIGQEFVGRIVGAQGSSINKIRDSLGVKIDFSDEHEDKDKDVGKKKKVTQQKARVKITGRKENVEEAKKRIIMHADRLVSYCPVFMALGPVYLTTKLGRRDFGGSEDPSSVPPFPHWTRRQVRHPP